MSAKQQNRAGMWNTQTPSYSEETQELLKVMMKESKLNNFQTRQLQKTMKDGATLPLACNPTTSAKPVQPLPAQKPSARIDPMGHGKGVRTKDAIEDSGAYERDMYRGGGATKSLDKEKQRLQNYMAYGEDIPPITEQRKREILKTPEPEPVMDRFADLEGEIQERVEFLEDMKKLGREGQYKAVISTEISQRIREMEIIDKQRTQQLKKAIAAKESSQGS